MFNFDCLDILCARIGHPSKKLWPFELLERFHCSILSVELKVNAVWICQELSCSIMIVSIYYSPESDVWEKIYYHLNYLIGSIVQFWASRYIISLTHTPESKVNAIEFVESFRDEFWLSRYIMRLNPTSEWKVMTIWITRELPLFNFERLDITWASNIHPSQKLRLFEFVESFRVHFRLSQYIMRLNWTSEWKVMTVLITRELPLFNFKRLNISWASIMQPSQKLWPFKFAKSFRVQFRVSKYIMRLNQIS